MYFSKPKSKLVSVSRTGKRTAALWPPDPPRGRGAAEATSARRQEGAAQRGQTGRGAAGRIEREEDLHRGGGVPGEPGRLLALRVREERVHRGRQHEGLRSALLEHGDPGPRPGQPQNAKSWDVKTKFFSIGGGHVQIYVSKNFVKENIWQWCNLIILYLCCCVSGLPVWRRGVGLKECKGLKTIKVKLKIYFQNIFENFYWTQLTR